MNDSLDQSLNEAYELIEADQIAEARAILEPLLEQYPDDPDVWWLYAHAVEDQAKAKEALQTVVDLDSGDTAAVNLLREVESGAPTPAGGIKPIKPLQQTPPPANLPDEAIDIDEPSEEELAGEPASRRGGVLAGIIGALVAVAAVVIGVALINPFGGAGDDPTPSPTAIVTEVSQLPTDPPPVATDEATEEVAVTEVVGETDEPTEAPPTATPTDVETEDATDAVTEEAAAAGSTDEVTEESTDEVGTTEEATDEAEATEEVTEEEAATDEATEEALETDEVPDATEEAEVTEEVAALSTEDATEEVGATEEMTDEAEATEEATDEAEATEEVTEEAAATDEAEATDEADGGTDAVMSALSEFNLAREEIERRTTALGETDVIGVCSAGRRGDTLGSVMTALTGVVDSLPQDTEAVGVELVNCDTEQALRTIAVPVEDAADFAAGEIDEAGFQGAWRPVS